MPTLTVHEIPTPEGNWLVRCDQFPKWRPQPVPFVDRAEMEKRLRAHQTRATSFQWFGMAAPSLEGMGYEEQVA